jgi:hypothetical protein
MTFSQPPWPRLEASTGTREIGMDERNTRIKGEATISHSEPDQQFEHNHAKIHQHSSHVSPQAATV